MWELCRSASAASGTRRGVLCWGKAHTRRQPAPAGAPPAHLHPRGSETLLHARVDVALHRPHTARRQLLGRQARQQRLQCLAHRQALVGGQGHRHDAADAHEQLGAVGGGLAVQPEAQKAAGQGVQRQRRGVRLRGVQGAASLASAVRPRPSQVRPAAPSPTHGFCSSTNSSGATQPTLWRRRPTAACWLPAGAAAANSCC